MRSLLPTLRTVEALVLSALAGGFIWLLGLDRWLPVLGFAVMGFFAGGTTTLRTLGYAIRDGRRRARLAVVCALVAVAALHLLRYGVFLASAARQVQATDWTLSGAEARALVNQELRQHQGIGGPVGFLLGEFSAGGWLLGTPLPGTALIVLRAAECLVAVWVARRWAAGEWAPRQRAPG